VEHPELARSIVYPGCFARFSGAPCRIRRRAPLIGEHNQEIYHGELGMPQEELVRLKEAGII
jgi:formyl-CoA transferase